MKYFILAGKTFLIVSFGYIGYHEFHHQRYLKYMQQEEAIQKGFLSEKEMKKFLKSKSVVDSHQGRQLMKQIYSSMHLVEDCKEKIKDLAADRIKIQNQIVKGEISEQEGNQKIQDLTNKILDIQKFLDKSQMLNSKFQVVNEEEMRKRLANI